MEKQPLLNTFINNVDMNETLTEIEEMIGGTVAWDRGDAYKGAYIWKELTGVNLLNESDWKQVAEFHANWSKKLFDAIIPYLKKIFG